LEHLKFFTVRLANLLFLYVLTDDKLKIMFAISHLGAKQSIRCVAQPDEIHVNRTASVLEWYDRHRAYNIWLKRRKIDIKKCIYYLQSAI